MIRPVISTEGDAVPRTNGAALIIPDYELLRRIGAGSYGEVWLARSTATGALRAIKVVYRSTFSEARPFQREFEGLLKFEAVSRAHPSQLALFHVGRNEAEGWFYYVMELADDSGSLKFEVLSVQPEGYRPRTLRTELEAGRLPAERVLEIACALTEALGHLHGNGLIHRDLKPSNIIFVQGRPKLADIGLVTDASTGGDRSIVGTEGYLPPEGPGTPAADIFALGKVLYEALTGLDRRQFPELPADLREWPDAKLAFELNAILVRASAADARQRYTSAEAMQEDLQRLVGGGSVRRRLVFRSRLKWGLMACGAALVTFAAYQFYVHRPNRPADNLGWTTNRLAGDAWEKGNYLLDRIEPETTALALENLREAIRLDTNFAYAHASLSGALMNQIAQGRWRTLNVSQEMDVHSSRALEIEPRLAWAHVMRADWLSLVKHDWDGAEREVLKALELEPGRDYRRYTLAYSVYVPQGRLEEGLKQLRLAIASDVTRRPSYNFAAVVLHYMGENEEAMKMLDEVDRLQPGLNWSREVRGQILVSQGRVEEALPLFRRFVEAASGLSGPTWGKALLFHAETLAGKRDSLTFTLDDLLANSEKPRGAFALALAYTALGDAQKALDWLETSYERREWDVRFVKVDPRLQALHAEPRFQSILKRMNLTP